DSAGTGPSVNPVIGQQKTNANCGLNEAAAVEYAKNRDANISFAVATSSGNIVAGYRQDAQTYGASITKAMILAARLRDLGSQPIPDSEKALMSAMIRQSDNNAANAEFAKTSRESVLDVANAAGMQN